MVGVILILISVFINCLQIHHDDFGISGDDYNKKFFQLASCMLQYCPKGSLAHKLGKAHHYVCLEVDYMAKPHNNDP